MNKLRLFGKIIGVSIRSQFQYRASFLLESTANFFSSITDFVGIWVLVDRFHTIQGWSCHEIALIYGIVHMGFSLAEGLGRGFDRFSRMIPTGEFDRVLLRPLGTAFQIAARQVQILKIGRFAQGLLVFTWGWLGLGYSILSFQLCIVACAVIGTASLFYGLFIVGATLSFWTTETLKILDIVTYGAREVGQFPLTIFPWWWRLFFTIAIPLSCVVYHPTASLVGQEPISLWIAPLFPCIGVVFLFLMLKVWRFGVRHYCVTGG
jgi:ABC-2 type transport system permease protein